MKRLKNNAGITLMEVIIVVALMGIIVPVVTVLISNSFKESNTISNKVKIQTSVTALMKPPKTINVISVKRDLASARMTISIIVVTNAMSLSVSA